MQQTDERLARAEQPSCDALRLHPFYRGKIQVLPKCPIKDQRDFAVWYTPGVAAPCKAIQADPSAVYEHTGKGNTVAVISDGSRVLGLGDIGPHAGLPVMEGKALLFKYLGGVDAVPLCVRARSTDELVAIVEALEPSFGGINLEDIAQPKCFEILDRLRRRLSIPVWHDDQQGTAVAVLAGLLNALKVVDKRIDDVRIALVGVGAANVAVYRLLCNAGIDAAALVACDSHGTLHANRRDIEQQQDVYRDKWRICRETNAARIVGGIADALRGADVCIAFSSPQPDLISPDWIQGMAASPVVFACANPLPEIWPWEATAAGAVVVATGRSDFPNQLNNSLVFPGVFRGVLDVRAHSITEAMAIAAAEVLAACAEDQGIEPEHILPTIIEKDVAARVAAATAIKAQEEGIAGRSATAPTLLEDAKRRIEMTRNATELLMRNGIIPPAPPV